LQKLVSIIIRTKNEEKWISSCLRSIFNQDYKNIEIILVDNDSEDSTVAKAQNFPIKLVKIQEFIPGKAINDGIKASSGEYIVCLSGHCIPVNNQWLTNLIEDLGSPNVAGVYGRQEPLSFTSDLDKRDLLTVFGLDKKIQVKDSFFHNANSAFRREIWDQFPFDESVTNIEDRVWGELLISKGYNIIYEPDASVYHWHGIHQDLNPDRAKNIVRILESLDTFNIPSNHQKPEDLKILAIIPIKGESSLLNNKYLLEKTVYVAQESKFISDIVVATDNKDTISLAKKLGVEAPFTRPVELSEDFVDIFDVVEFTVGWYRDQNKQYDLIVLLEEVYPFRSIDMIDKMITKLVYGGHDTVLAGISESRSIWLETKDSVELIGSEENLFTPRLHKDSENIIGLLGLCCVTQTASMHGKKIFSGNVGIVKINDPVETISIRNDRELFLASIIDKNIH
jgi:rhamnosyltransferase